jgi:hypothetical protein
MTEKHIVASVPLPRENTLDEHVRVVQHLNQKIAQLEARLLAIEKKPRPVGFGQ